jgi:hypothetical protein
MLQIKKKRSTVTASPEGGGVSFSKSRCYREIIKKNDVIAVFSKASKHAVTGGRGRGRYSSTHYYPQH